MSYRVAGLAVVLILSVVPTARADIVRFTSGVEVRGKVTRQRGRIMIENENGTTTVPASRVEQITQEPPARESRVEAPTQVERVSEEPLSEDARAQAAPPTGGNIVAAVGGADDGPRIGMISTGMRLDVRPIVGPRRRYVYLELRGRRAYAPTWRTYRFQTPRTRRR